MFIMKPALDKFGIRLDRAFSYEDAFLVVYEIISGNRLWIMKLSYLRQV